jgi:hypothetical protein
MRLTRLDANLYVTIDQLFSSSILAVFALMLIETITYLYRALAGAHIRKPRPSNHCLSMPEVHVYILHFTASVSLLLCRFILLTYRTLYLFMLSI